MASTPPLFSEPLNAAQERMRKWSDKFLKWLGHALPESYLTFDIEATGFRRGRGDSDLPIDIGHCIVRDRQVVHQGSYLLNWSGYPGVDREWLRERIDRVRRNMAERGKDFPYTVERLEMEGKHPADVLKFYWRLFIKNRRAGFPFVGQNAWSYDAVLLNDILKQALDITFNFRPDELYDCGAMEKAILAGDLEPYPDEHDLQTYFKRIVHAPRKGIHWNIEACVDRYDLERRFNLSKDDLHGAQADAYIAHLLFEEHRNAFAS